MNKMVFNGYFLSIPNLEKIKTVKIRIFKYLLSINENYQGNLIILWNLNQNFLR